MVTVRGKVRSGLGDFGGWIERLRPYYRAKTGLDLYPGTLNIELGQPYTLPERPLRLEAEEYGGNVSVSLVPCHIFGRRAFLLRTDANENGSGAHPRTIIEIATDLELRRTYQLRDGDDVDIVFDG